MKIKARLDLDIKQLKEDLGLGENCIVQRHIDSFVLYRSEPYLPGRHIHQQGIIATELGSGKVIWDSPDANYLYEGKLMVDPITLKGAFYNPSYGFWSRPNTQKIIDPKGRDLNYHGGGNRGSHWFDRMMDDRMDELEESILKVMNL